MPVYSLKVSMIKADFHDGRRLLIRGPVNDDRGADGDMAYCFRHGVFSCSLEPVSVYCARCHYPTKAAECEHSFLRPKVPEMDFRHENWVFEVFASETRFSRFSTSKTHRKESSRIALKILLLSNYFRGRKPIFEVENRFSLRKGGFLFSIITVIIYILFII